MNQFIENAQINLLDIPDKQKLSTINNLNGNLKSLKLLFCQPVSFLLYIGKVLKNLDTLDVVFLGNTIVKNSFNKECSIKPSKYFDKFLSDNNLDLFRNFKIFKFTIRSSIQVSSPLVLETILSRWKGCKEKLTTFEFIDFKGEVKELIYLLQNHASEIFKIRIN